MSDKVIYPLFYSDLFTKQNIGTEKQRKVLLDKIHYLKKNNIDSVGGSNEGCFRSTYEYGEELDWLRETIRDFIVEISEFYIKYDEAYKTQLSQKKQQVDMSFWTNVNEPGSTNVIHTHKGVSFACTYNLQTSGTGDLVFRNPANILNDCNSKSPFVRYMSIEPKDGDLLVWPAWIPHEVEINKSDKQRINIASNIKLIGAKE